MPLNIKRVRKTIPFYPDGSIAAEIEAASEAVVEAKKSVANDGRLASKAQAALKAAEKAYEAAVARGAASVLDVELEALPRKRFAEIEANHPARDGDKIDEAYAVNWDTFLAEAFPESVKSVKEQASGGVVEVTPAEWVAALDEISDGQYTTFAGAVLGLNRNQQRPF